MPILACLRSTYRSLPGTNERRALAVCIPASIKGNTRTPQRPAPPLPHLRVPYSSFVTSQKEKGGRLTAHTLPYFIPPSYIPSLSLSLARARRPDTQRPVCLCRLVRTTTATPRSEFESLLRRAGPRGGGDPHPAGGGGGDPASGRVGQHRGGKAGRRSESKYPRAWGWLAGRRDIFSSSFFF